MIYSKQLRVYSNNFKIWVTLTSSAVETAGIVAGIVAAGVDSAVEEASVAEATVQNRCFLLFVASAETSAKCHLDQVETDLFSAVTVSKRKVVETTGLNLLQRDLTATRDMGVRASSAPDYSGNLRV